MTLSLNSQLVAMTCSRRHPKAGDFCTFTFNQSPWGPGLLVCDCPLGPGRKTQSCQYSTAKRSSWTEKRWGGCDGIKVWHGNKKKKKKEKKNIFNTFASHSVNLLQVVSVRRCDVVFVSFFFSFLFSHAVLKTESWRFSIASLLLAHYSTCQKTLNRIREQGGESVLFFLTKAKNKIVSVGDSKNKLKASLELVNLIFFQSKHKMASLYLYFCHFGIEVWSWL